VTYLRAFAWLLIIGLVVVTMAPASERPVTRIELALGFSGSIFALAYSQRPIPLMLSAIVFSAVLELMQIPLPTKHARLEDFFTDALASYVGIGFARCPREY
jgi:hypothetical protein